MILNFILVLGIISFAVFEIIHIKNEYKESKSKKDLFNIVLQIFLLVIAIVILIFSAIVFNQGE